MRLSMVRTVNAETLSRERMEDKQGKRSVGMRIPIGETCRHLPVARRWHQYGRPILTYVHTELHAGFLREIDVRESSTPVSGADRRDETS